MCVSCSAVIKGRKPCAKDPNLDYEVMSDEEWEEEPEGESLSVSLEQDSNPYLLLAKVRAITEGLCQGKALQPCDDLFSSMALVPRALCQAREMLCLSCKQGSCAAKDCGSASQSCCHAG